MAIELSEKKIMQQVLILTKKSRLYSNGLYKR